MCFPFLSSSSNLNFTNFDGFNILDEIYAAGFQSKGFKKSLVEIFLEVQVLFLSLHQDILQIWLKIEINW